MKTAALLTSAEVKMIGEGHYEQPSKAALQRGLAKALQLKGISVEIGKKHILHDFNLTAF